MIRVRSAVNLHGQDLHLIVTDIETGVSLEFSLTPAQAWTMLQGGEVTAPRDGMTPARWFNPRAAIEAAWDELVAPNPGAVDTESAAEPPTVTLADGAVLGEVDPSGTPVEWRDAGSIEWRPGVVVRLRDRGVPVVVMDVPVGDRTHEIERPARYVRRRPS